MITINFVCPSCEEEFEYDFSLTCPVVTNCPYCSIKLKIDYDDVYGQGLVGMSEIVSDEDLCKWKLDQQQKSVQSLTIDDHQINFVI